MSTGRAYDDDGYHPLLLSITVARRDCPTLSFAALRLHVHLRERKCSCERKQALVKRYWSGKGRCQKRIYDIPPLMGNNHVCDTDHRLIGDPSVPNFYVSLPPSAHLDTDQV